MHVKPPPSFVRLWNTHASWSTGPFVAALPGDVQALLRERENLRPLDARRVWKRPMSPEHCEILDAIFRRLRGPSGVPPEWLRLPAPAVAIQLQEKVICLAVERKCGVISFCSYCRAHNIFEHCADFKGGTLLGFIDSCDGGGVLGKAACEEEVERLVVQACISLALANLPRLSTTIRHRLRLRGAGRPPTTHASTHLAMGGDVWTEVRLPDKRTVDLDEVLPPLPAAPVDAAPTAAGGRRLHEVSEFFRRPPRSAPSAEKTVRVQAHARGRRDLGCVRPAFRVDPPDGSARP